MRAASRAEYAGVTVELTADNVRAITNTAERIGDLFDADKLGGEFAPGELDARADLQQFFLLSRLIGSIDQRERRRSHERRTPEPAWLSETDTDLTERGT